MAVSSIKAGFECDIEKVWRIVTSLDDYSWRSDISKIEVLSDKQFVEYTKDGYQTTFTITVFEPYKRYEFDMENDNMRGHWTGIFSKEGAAAVIDFTEDVTAKKLIMKPFVSAYLKRQQSKYIEDLKRIIEGGKK